MPLPLSHPRDYNTPETGRRPVISGVITNTAYLDAVR